MRAAVAALVTVLLPLAAAISPCANAYSACQQCILNFYGDPAVLDFDERNCNAGANEASGKRCGSAIRAATCLSDALT